MSGSLQAEMPGWHELPPPPPGRSGWPWLVTGSRLQSAASANPSLPRVSIVTPSYNQGRYIEETIRSVLLQDYPNLEYIVMDGGSTDGSVEIIRRYEPWISYWVSQPDGGQSQAINQGWARATGDILAYLNTDDYYLSGALESVVRGFAAEPEAGMVYGDAKVVDEVNQVLRTWRARTFTLRAMLTEGNVVPQSASFYSRRALQSVGYLAEEFEMIMDYELSIRIGLRFASVRLPVTLAAFRDHALSKSRTRFASMARELLRLVDQLALDQASAQAVSRLRQRTLSRLHYEWAMACVAGGEPEAGAGRHLRASMRHDPRFALTRPIHTGYLVKEIVRQRLRGANAQRDG